MRNGPKMHEVASSSGVLPAALPQIRAYMEAMGLKPRAPRGRDFQDVSSYFSGLTGFGGGGLTRPGRGGEPELLQ